MKYTVILFYKYVNLELPDQVVREQYQVCEELGLKGRILIGYEGINGTLGGPERAIQAYIDYMRGEERFEDIDFKHSPGQEGIFPRLQVTERPEIVTLEAEQEVDLTNRGQHLSPEEFHDLIQQEEVVALDVRNSYEHAIGRFRGAKTLDIDLFKNLPQAVADIENQLQDKKVAMYCTGDIRCEKASALLRERGVDEVYQLAGGIHRYLEKFPDGGQWRGELFVFDGRMKIAFKENPEKLGECLHCGENTNHYQNCAYAPCNRLMLICGDCRAQTEVCSQDCAQSWRETAGV